MAHVIASFEKNLFQVNLKSDTANTILADEPLTKGGGDTGFSPMELLAGSLAACTVATLRMYANHKEWDLQDVEVDTNLEWSTEINATAINRNIKLIGNLDQKQLDRLMQVAESCPVHKILTHTMHITTNKQ